MGREYIPELGNFPSLIHFVMKEYHINVNAQFQLKSIAEAGILQKITINFTGALYEKKITTCLTGWWQIR